MIALPAAATPSLVWAAPSPSPSPTEQLDATTVTPGLVGFLATFAVVLAAIGLFQLMTRSLRRATRNAQSQGIEVAEPARVGRGVQLPVRAPEPTVPGVLDGGTPYGPPPSQTPPTSQTPPSQTPPRTAGDDGDDGANG